MPAERGAGVLVVNADDFGHSAAVNEAIDQAFRAGLISSASLMTGMPGFADAAARARAGGYDGRLGFHLDLSEGLALTPAIRQCARICGDDGRLAMQPSTRFRLSPAERAAVAHELDAQADAGLAAGIRPTHLDSHGHTHTQWPVASIVLALARRLGVGAVRLSRNLGPAPSPAKQLYKVLFNARLHWAGVARVRYFGSVRDVEGSLDGLRGACEVMVHPVRSEEGELIDQSDRPEPLAAAIGRLGSRRRVSFAELAAAGG